MKYMDKHREMKKFLRLSCRVILINFFSYGFEIFYPICCFRKRSAASSTLYKRYHHHKVPQPMDSPYIGTSIASLIVIELTLPSESVSEIDLDMKDASYIYVVNVKDNGIVKFVLGCVYLYRGTALALIILFVLHRY